MVTESYLKHHGILGQKWGVRRYQNKDGTRTVEGKKHRNQSRVFVSGTSKMQSEDSLYYRKSLPKEVTDYLDENMKKGSRFLVGDCVGADTVVQKYLAKNNYNNVHIYVTGDEVRNNADDGSLGWKIHHIDGSMYEKDSKEWHAVKDKAMNKDATEGLAIILENGGAGATRRNINRLIDEQKDVMIYELRGEDSTNDVRLSVDEFLKENSQ